MITRRKFHAKAQGGDDDPKVFCFGAFVPDLCAFAVKLFKDLTREPPSHDNARE
jgi:hypothetical protein